jgi:hypothetical protein
MQAAVANTPRNDASDVRLNRDTHALGASTGRGCSYLALSGWLCRAPVLASSLAAFDRLAHRRRGCRALADERLADDVYRFEHDVEVHAALQAPPPRPSSKPTPRRSIKAAGASANSATGESPQLKARQPSSRLSILNSVRHYATPVPLCAVCHPLAVDAAPACEHNAEIRVITLPRPLLGGERPDGPAPTQSRRLGWGEEAGRGCAGGVAATAAGPTGIRALQGIRVSILLFAAPIGTKSADHGAKSFASSPWRAPTCCASRVAVTFAITRPTSTAAAFNDLTVANPGLH